MASESKEVFEYLVSYGISIGELEDRVDEWLKDGWILVGGVAVSDRRFYQAMKREVAPSD
jgi:hypothetical protein